MSLLPTLDVSGMGPAMLRDGAENWEAFDAFVEEVLLPALRPGQTVVLDNLSVQKSPRSRALVEAAGCQVRFLPLTSPDLHPIELAFAQIKQGLRGAAARTSDTVLAATGLALDAITPADAHGCFAHRGYLPAGQRR